MPKRRGESGKHRTGRSGQLLIRRRVLTPGNLLVALIGFIFLTCASAVLVLNLRSIYYFDVEHLQLEQQTGLSEEIIKKNYDTLIDYNLIASGVKELEFPSFSMSENGRTHFAEVKRIFVAIQYLMVVSGVFLLIGLWGKIGRGDYGSLKLISILTFVVPVVLGILAVFCWEQFFTVFHRIFFRNDYWIFDPITDPVIYILPDEFFAHCAAAILIFLLLGGVICWILYRFLTGKYRKNRR